MRPALLTLFYIFISFLPLVAAHEEAAGGGISTTMVGHVAVILITITVVVLGLGVTKTNKTLYYIIGGVALLGLYHLLEIVGGEAFESIEHDVEHVLTFISIALIGFGLYKLKRK
jgi:lipopolysaccharide export LptBFGC system permease protein LptF